MMKLLPLLFAVAFQIGHMMSYQALPAATYDDSLTGKITQPGSGMLSLGAEATGGLPGVFTMSLNHSGTTISQGNWRLIVKRRNSDDSISELGALTGIVSSGTVSLNADGSVSSLNSVRLTIQSGSGDYAGVTSGAGTLAGALNHQASLPFSGTLTVSF